VRVIDAQRRSERNCRLAPHHRYLRNQTTRCLRTAPLQAREATLGTAACPTITPTIAITAARSVPP
jgi:hypothetical protein